jgi:hypothetical protein
MLVAGRNHRETSAEAGSGIIGEMIGEASRKLALAAAACGSAAGLARTRPRAE